MSGKSCTSSLQRPDLIQGPASCLFTWDRGLFSEGRWPSHHAEHSPLSSADVRNE